jgi:hypothetical protein
MTYGKEKGKGVTKKGLGVISFQIGIREKMIFEPMNSHSS